MKGETPGTWSGGLSGVFFRLCFDKITSHGEVSDFLGGGGWTHPWTHSLVCRWTNKRVSWGGYGGRCFTRHVSEEPLSSLLILEQGHKVMVQKVHDTHFSAISKRSLVKDIPAQCAKIRQGLDIFRISSKCVCLSNGEV